MRQGHHFYGKAVIPDREQHLISEILKKYKNETPNEELKKKIWNDLQKAKGEGLLTIPFKIALRKGLPGAYPTQVEVILDTKV